VSTRWQCGLCPFSVVVGYSSDVAAAASAHERQCHPVLRPGVGTGRVTSSIKADWRWLIGLLRGMRMHR